MTAQRFHPGDSAGRAGGPAQGDPDAQKALPDLDSPGEIRRLVRHFYHDRLLRDPVMAPLFLEVARVDLEHHLPIIEQYWRKMLLGERGYQRHTMERHRALHARAPLRGEHFERWLAHFHAAVSAGWQGPCADRARHIATRVADNMYRHLPEHY